jgi:hypothetical protein
LFHYDELFVFEHDSDAWICKRQVITLQEEAGDKVLGGGAGAGEEEGTYQNFKFLQNS